MKLTIVNLPPGYMFYIGPFDIVLLGVDAAGPALFPLQEAHLALNHGYVVQHLVLMHWNLSDIINIQSTPFSRIFIFGNRKNLQGTMLGDSGG